MPRKPGIEDWALGLKAYGEVALRGKALTMDELLRENKETTFDLSGPKL